MEYDELLIFVEMNGWCEPRILMLEKQEIFWQRSYNYYNFRST